MKMWIPKPTKKKGGSNLKIHKSRNKISNFINMKNLLTLVMIFFAVGIAKTQSANTAASDHVFVMCDEYGSPIISSGQAFYMAFYSNSQVIMMCGSDLSRAISNKKSNPSTSKSGTWQSSASKLWFTWSDGKRSEDWILDGYSGNFSSGSVLLKDLGKF